jgi:hypothetical protein
VSDRRTRLLRLGAGQLAAIVGMLHLWLGVREWSLYLGGGILLPPDVRVPLWTLSGVGLLVGVAIVALEDITDRRVYAAGAALALTYVLGYYSWHLGGHRSFFLTGDPQLHDVGPIEFVVSHTFAGPIEFFALLTEAALLVTLLALLRRPEPGR